MKLVLAVINGDELASVHRSLIEHGFRITLLGGAGGFIKAGNTAILSAMEDEQVYAAMQLLNSFSQAPGNEDRPPTTRQVSTSSPAIVDTIFQNGMTIFIFQLERYVHL